MVCILDYDMDCTIKKFLKQIKNANSEFELWTSIQNNSQLWYNKLEYRILSLGYIIKILHSTF